MKNGTNVFDKKEDVKISTNESEAADYPDGSIRYKGEVENESEERLERVKNTTGACTYENVNLMTEISKGKKEAFEALIDYLIEQDCEVEIYLQPFSVIQCEYSFDKGMNKGFSMVEEYLTRLAENKGIVLRGSYDVRNFGLTDNRFIDSMHLDKIGTNIVWNYND